MGHTTVFRPDALKPNEFNEDNRYCATGIMLAWRIASTFSSTTPSRFIALMIDMRVFTKPWASKRPMQTGVDTVTYRAQATSAARMTLTSTSAPIHVASVWYFPQLLKSHPGCVCFVVFIADGTCSWVLQASLLPAPRYPLARKARFEKTSLPCVLLDRECAYVVVDGAIVEMPFQHPQHGRSDGCVGIDHVTATCVTGKL